MRHQLARILFALTIALLVVGCGGGEGTTAQATTVPAAQPESPTAVPAQPAAAPTAEVLPPVIDKAEVFPKEETTLQQADVLVVTVRNVEYDESTRAFVDDLQVLIDGTPMAYHDVKALDVMHYWIEVDLPEGVTSGTVQVTYADQASESVPFALE